MFTLLRNITFLNQKVTRQKTAIHDRVQEPLKIIAYKLQSEGMNGIYFILMMTMVMKLMKKQEVETESITLINLY